MARRRLFDDEGKIIKMKKVEEKKSTSDGRRRFFNDEGKSEFEKAQEKVKETKESVDPFAGQVIKKATGEEKKKDKKDYFWEGFKSPFTLGKKAVKFISEKTGISKPKSEVYEDIVETGRAKELHYGRSGHIGPESKAIGLGKSVVGGVAGMIEGTGRALEWLGVDSLKPYDDKLEKWRQSVEVENPTYGEKLAGGIGSMLMFYVPGAGVSRGTQMISKVSPRIAAIFGGSTMTGLEAMTESGFAWKEAQDMGKSEEEADGIAENVFWSNSVLIGITNKLAYFSPKSQDILKRVLIPYGSEFSQEYGQAVISNVNLGKQWDEGAYESGGIGGIIGVIFGFGRITNNNRGEVEKTVADRLQMSPQEAADFVTVIQQFQEEESEKSAIERQKEIDVAIEEKKKPVISFVEKQDKARDEARDILRVETLKGRREDFRLDNDLFIKKFEDLFPKGTTSETEISVYRASATEIKKGDQVTTNRANVEKYLKIREGSELQEVKVKLKDLVRNEGLRNEFVYAPKEERIVKIPEISEKTKPQEATTEVKKEILIKEEIADMKELKKKKEVKDKEIAEIEKDEVRVEAGKELAKRIKKEERITGKIIKYKGEEYEVLEDFWYAPARDENVTRIQNIKTKKSIVVAESELVIKAKPKEKKEIRELKPTEAKTSEEILREVIDLDITKYTTISGKYARPPIGKIELKTLLKNIDEFRENPVLTVTSDKDLEFIGEKTRFTIKAEALQLKKENLVVGEEILIDEKALKEKGAQMQMRIPKGKGGTPGASVGTFADGTPIKTGSLKEILPIQFPDLIHLIRQVGSSVEINRRLRTSRGLFKGGHISLHKDLFSNTEQATKTLAHEIGHLIDWIPDKAMDRGNILGRLFSLRKFLNKIKNEEYRNELWELSQYWRPMPEIVSDNFLKYRKSPAELYADAISVLLNSPGLLEEKAPNFYKSFFENLDRKPVVFEEFFSLQEELRMGSNELTKKWRKRIGGTKGMYEKANYKAIEIQKHKEDEIKKERSIGQLWAQTKRGVFSLHSDYETKIKEVKKRGGTVNDNENPVYYLNERNYVGSKIKSVIEKNLLPALEEIKKSGITQEELGEILFYERILKGDRGEVANPGGFQKEFIEEMMGENVDPKTKEIKQNEGSLRKELGEEKFAIIKEQAKVFRSGLKKIFEMGYREGIYNDELYKLMQENEYYVPFKTQKYMDQKTKASVSKKVGTLSDIENPINTSIEKAMAIVRTIENNKAKEVGILFLQKEFSEDIEKAKTRFVNDRLEIIDVRDKTVFYMKGGKPVGFYVPKYVADSLNNRTTEEIKVITHTLGRVNRKWFKPVFVGINTGFHIANFARDFFRFWKNIPKMSFSKAFKLYYKAYPHARKKAKVESDVLVAEMEEEGILGLTLNDYMAGGTEEDIQNDIIMSKIGLAQEKKSFFEGRKIFSPIAFTLDKIKEMGDTIEALPKIAGYIHFKGDEAGPKISMGEKDFMRRYVGSPDFFAKGSWTKNTNDIFLFSNAIIQGVRSDYEVATNPETRLEFWWKTAKVTFVPKMLMAAATMGIFGELLKEIMDEATEYDKTNYIIIPVGKDENKKAIYFRLPQDETSRFIGGMFWKTQRFLTSGDLESMQDILGLWGGQLPGITPAIALPGDLFQFATGKNVYDTYRQRTVLTEDQAIAGWKYKAKPVAVYVWNQAGGNIFLKLYSGEPTEPLTPKENFLRLPIVSNVIGRFFKVTDYGKVEILRKEVTDPIRKEVAEKRMEDKKLINEYVEKVRGSSGVFERRKIERELAEKIIGHKPKGSEEMSEAKRIIKKLDIAIIKGQSDDVVNSLIYARTNKEKTELLNGYKESMSETEFSNLRTLLLKHKIVSRDVFNKLSK